MTEYATILKFKQAYLDFKKCERFLLKEYDNYDEKKQKVVLNNLKKKYCEPLDNLTAQLSRDELARFEQGKL